MEGLPTYFGVCSLLQDKFREYSHSPEAPSKETSPGELTRACSTAQRIARLSLSVKLAAHCT